MSNHVMLKPARSMSENSMDYRITAPNVDMEAVSKGGGGGRRAATGTGGAGGPEAAALLCKHGTLKYWSEQSRLWQSK